MEILRFLSVALSSVEIIVAFSTCVFMDLVSVYRDWPLLEVQSLQT